MRYCKAFHWVWIGVFILGCTAGGEAPEPAADPQPGQAAPKASPEAAPEAAPAPAENPKAPADSALADAEKQRKAKGLPTDPQPLTLGKLGPDPRHIPTKENPFPMAAEQRDMLEAMGRPTELTLRSYSLPLNNPPVVASKDADHMKDSDPVLGLLVGEHARAYPWWIVIAYHVINDTFSEFPVYVAQCEVCSGAGAFYPVVDGWPLDFRVCGALHGTFYVCDFQTKSTWYSFSGTSFAGPLEGHQLPRLPVYQTTWGEWKALHPHTDVIDAPETLKERPHGQGQWLGKPVVEHQLEMTVRRRDDRLVEHELVFGLIGKEPESGLVYPLVALEDMGGLVQEEYNGDPFLLLLQGESRVSAYVREIEGKELRFEVTQKSPIRLKDKETGTLWNEWGRGLEGPHAGKQLPFANGYLTEWYEWSGHYPLSKIEGLPLKRSSADRKRKSAPDVDPGHKH